MLTQQERDGLQAEFMSATRGFDAHTVVLALGQQTSGTNWRGSSKGHMAEQFAMYSRRPGSGHHLVDLTKLTQSCANLMAKRDERRARMDRR